MFLANKFIERSRPHPRGQRRSFVDRRKIDIFLFKQVLHEAKLRREPRHFQLQGTTLSSRGKQSSGTSRVKRRIT